MNHIHPSELAEWMKSGADFQLIDVREEEEHAEYHIGGLLIPLDDILHQLAAIEQQKPVVFYCRKGIRSQLAIQRLQLKFSFTNLVNLAGGMDAWKKAVGKALDPGSSSSGG